MRIIDWFKFKLSSLKNGNKERLIQELRKEIERLRKENKALKEKVIPLPQNNSEKVHLKFYYENIEKEIIKNIGEAKEELCIAVAWFTSTVIMEELRRLKERGVYIRVIINGDDKNEPYVEKLEEGCNGLRKVVLPNYGSFQNFMHNKYCIIDNKRVIDGSYNWTKGAKYNLEHIIVIESKTAAKMYKENFEAIYNSSDYNSSRNSHRKLG